ncbi:orotidine-5'-phosphate decarboxylase [Photobacterium leiognathi]|uniref:orotidine-5'-phosphate decarboxylase n=1 Tax=Photobacterium leiognathi TaxID=553611 RepID=UPI0027397F4F|nr:orotidine-5'-phosphate decarboxylase [Photobacterium leiognathi]
MTFLNKLENAWSKNQSLLCIGLDPLQDKFPSHLRENVEQVFEFNKQIIDATHDLVCAYKPQMAHFASMGAEEQLEKTIKYIQKEHPHIPIILDAKRGDIGSTAEKYAHEAFVRYGVDAVTVNPYLGSDSITPFTNYKDKGTILLCRTSNKGAEDLQDLEVDGEALYLKIARKIGEDWNENKNCLAVVGATWPEQMKAVRQILPITVFLVPGIGSQGGNVEEMILAGKDSKGRGLIISSSRAIIYASNEVDFAMKSREVAMKFRNEINTHL